MNLTKALSNAVSGLQASGRGTETVSSNLANIMTPAYARRELSVSSQSWSGNMGGVQVNGVNRIVNNTLVAEARIATAAQADAQTRAGFLTSMEQLVGVPGEPGSFSSALTDFQKALVSASSRPDDEVRLSAVVNAASRLTQRLNEIADGIQAARTAADQQIAVDVANLNTDLERVAELNRRISSLAGSGVETLSMEDERQTIIDRISRIVPVQQVERPGNKVALFATGGAILLDGSKPARISFEATGGLSAGMSAENAEIGGLSINGEKVSAGRLHLVGGGSLTASFAIRDELAPQLQKEIDAVALDLHDRLIGENVDTTRGGQPGLFTDDGSLADANATDGLSSRLRVNAILLSGSGEVWRVRDGIGAAEPGSVGDNSLLNRISAALAENHETPHIGSSSFKGSAVDISGELSARLGTRRVSADSELAVSNARSTTLLTRLMADGVDSDAEMRRLLQYEHAYSANAKVIKTIDEMFQTLLRI